MVAGAVNALCDPRPGLAQHDVMALYCSQWEAEVDNARKALRECLGCDLGLRS